MKNKFDFTHGPLSKQLVLFCLPLFATNLLQYCYQATDMIVVGWASGNVGLVAISNASMITFVVNSLAIGLATGGTVAIARRKGARDRTGQRVVSTAMLAIAFACAVVVTVTGIAAAPVLFEALAVPTESLGGTCSYMAIVCGGAVFTFGYQAICSLMKGLGDAKTPLVLIAIAAVVNVVLDIVFVLGLGWGVAGAAWATVIAQAFACLFACLFLFGRFPDARPVLRRGTGLRAVAAEILKVSAPASFQMVVVNISYLLVTGLLNAFGTEVAAASGIGLKISTFAGLPCWAIGQAVTAMVSQNEGAGLKDRMAKTVKSSLVLAVGIIVVIQVFTQIFAYDLVRFFGAVDAATIETAVLYLRITCSINGLFYAAMYCFDSFALGAGAPNLALVNSLLDAVAIRFALAWVLSTVGFGFVGIYVAQAVSPIIPTIIGYLYFKRGAWRKEGRRD